MCMILVDLTPIKYELGIFIICTWCPVDSFVICNLSVSVFHSPLVH